MSKKLEQKVEDLNNNIIEAINASCKLSDPKKTKDAQWWNTQLAKERKEVRKYFNRAKRDGNYEKYKSKLNSYNKEIWEGRRSHFRTSVKAFHQYQKQVGKGNKKIGT